MQAELAQLRGQTEAAHQAERLATARAAELERLVEQVQRQLNEMERQRDTAVQRITEAEEAREALRRQLQQLQETARTERENLIRHVQATEDRAHAEVDRARQETKAAQLELATLRKEAAKFERNKSKRSNVPKRMHLPDRTQAFGLMWHGLPIVDGAAPDHRFLDQWRQLGPELASALNAGARVVVHCKGGLGRAGTVASMLLLRGNQSTRRSDAPCSFGSAWGHRSPCGRSDDHDIVSEHDIVKEKQRRAKQCRG